jgi:hypothetical protein
LGKSGGLSAYPRYRLGLGLLYKTLTSSAGCFHGYTR